MDNKEKDIQQDNTSSDKQEEIIDQNQETEQACENKEPVEEKKESEVDLLKKQVETLTAQVNELKNEAARAYADCDNIRKRLNSEHEKANKYRIQSFAVEVLPALDNLERALNQPVTKENEALHKGMEMIYKQIKSALEKEGISEVEALNKPFDPQVHQSVMSEKVDGVESDMVVEVLQKGYMLKDRLIRPSLVKISE